MVEVGARRCFASALDHPGWARSGNDEAAALAALEAYRGRYGAVVARAGVAAPTGQLAVACTVPGNATTDFGAPSAIVEADRTPLSRADRDRLVFVLDACWSAFDAAVARPTELRLGPRGGGRSFEKLHRHVLDAEVAYARAMGVRVAATEGDPARVAAVRDTVRALVAGRRDADREPSWPLRFGVRRTAWHVLDHLFELEDRSGPTPA